MVIFLVLGCTPKGQLFTLETNNETLAENNFVFTDSIVEFRFRFYEEKGFLSFVVKNKSERPIYIDWKNSMFIPTSSRQYAYWRDETLINANIYSSQIILTSWLWPGVGHVQGTAITPDRISFLPPNTELWVKKFKMVRGHLKLNDPEVLSQNANWKRSRKKVKVQRKKFHQENTPLNFRNYLTISTTENFSQPIYYDFGFWVSEIQTMNAKHLIGSSLFMTHSDSIETPGLHPYKRANRFFIF